MLDWDHLPAIYLADLGSWARRCSNVPPPNSELLLNFGSGAVRRPEGMTAPVRTRSHSQNLRFLGMSNNQPPDMGVATGRGLLRGSSAWGSATQMVSTEGTGA